MKYHKGTIRGVKKFYDTELYGPNLGYVITGRWEDHPNFGNSLGQTSLVVSQRELTEHDEDDNCNVYEIETLNSIYTWVELKTS